MTASAAKPLYRDPVFDGAADPVLIWNRAERAWWMVYTARRANLALADDVSWIHGTDLGVASSTDGGTTWLYRGILQGLDTEPGRHTYWAPEIVDDGESYHMYVSVIRGVPSHWAGHDRVIRHYRSTDLWHWTFVSTLDLSSRRVIDACVHPLPAGGFRLWYKDETDGSHTWYADSPDLETWSLGGPAVTISAHEGPNVFRLGDAYWMLVDEWRGQRVLRSDDLNTWTAQGLLLDGSGSSVDDAGVGHHADVVVRGDDALIFYFTHPGWRDRAGDPFGAAERRTVIQVARLTLSGDTLACDRDAALPAPFLPEPTLSGPGR